MKGLYSYKYMQYVRAVRTLVDFTVRVEVLKESKNTYQVKYLGLHASGAAVGTTAWVRKDKVKLDEPPQVQPTPPRDDIRLPYKD